MLPSTVELTGTVRSFDALVQDAIEAAIRDIAAGVARSSGTAIEVDYVRYYPATINSEREAGVALAAARSAGLDATVAAAPAFTSEDFAFMLRQVPGAYLWLGQGRSMGAHNPPLHHPSYDFDDEALARGIAWFAKVVELELGAPVPCDSAIMWGWPAFARSIMGYRHPIWRGEASPPCCSASAAAATDRRSREIGVLHGTRM